MVAEIHKKILDLRKKMGKMVLNREDVSDFLIEEQKLMEERERNLNEKNLNLSSLGN